MAKAYPFLREELESVINQSNDLLLKNLYMNGYFKKEVSLKILQEAVYTVVIETNNKLSLSCKGLVNLHKLFKENKKRKELEKQSSENPTHYECIQSSGEEAGPPTPPWEKKE